MAAASSPCGPPNCSSIKLARPGSDSETLTVYCSRLLCMNMGRLLLAEQRLQNPSPRSEEGVGRKVHRRLELIAAVDGEWRDRHRGRALAASGIAQDRVGDVAPGLQMHMRRERLAVGFELSCKVSCSRPDRNIEAAGVALAARGGI